MIYKITVITINLNNAEGLRRTIKSVVEQHQRNIEYIVIDGGSTDGSLDVIREFADKIHYWVSEKDSGIYEAMNKAIDLATGYYLNFLNSGDHYSNPLSLKMLLDSSDQKDIVYGNISVVEENNTWVKKYPAYLNFKYLMVDTLPHPASLIRKRMFDIIGFYDTSLKVVADWKFFILAVIRHKASYIYVDKNIAHFYYDGISSNSDNQGLITNERIYTLNECFPMRMEWINFKQKIKSLKKNLFK